MQKILSNQNMNKNVQFVHPLFMHYERFKNMEKLPCIGDNK